MTAVTLMAKALQRELFDRGVRAFPIADCEAIMARVLETSADMADALMPRPIDFAREAATDRARAIEAAIIRFRECGVELQRFSIVEQNGVTHLCVDGVCRFTWSIRWPDMGGSPDASGSYHSWSGGAYKP